MSFVLLVPRNWGMFAEILISFCRGRIHQRSLCYSYDSWLSDFGTEWGIFLFRFSTKQSNRMCWRSTEPNREPKHGKDGGSSLAFATKRLL